MLTPIKLKFGTHNGLTKAHLHTTFGWNLSKFTEI